MRKGQGNSGPRPRDRGTRASFDRRTGEVSGSGAGAGNNPDSSEDYDSDLHEEKLAPAGAAADSPS